MNPTNGTVRRLINGREYLIHVPAGLTGPNVPLLVSIHGNTGSAKLQESFTGWSGYVDSTKNFIVAYPQGTPIVPGLQYTWNTSANSSDIKYVRDVIADIKSTWCIDPKRVHTDGHSQGSQMSQRMACDAGDIIASAVTYAGGDATLFNSGPCKPIRPISIGMFHGTLDFVVPVQVDRDSIELWRASDRDNCTGGNPTSNVRDTYGSTETYDGCSAGVKLILRLVNGANHLWPTGDGGADTRTRMWNFLAANPMP